MLQRHTEEQRLSIDSEGARGDDGGHWCVCGSLRLVKGWAGTEHCLFSLVAIKVQSCETLTAPGPRPAPTSPSDTGPFLVTSKPAGVTEETKMSRSQGPFLQHLARDHRQGSAQASQDRAELGARAVPSRHAGSPHLPCCSPYVCVKDTAMKCK